MNSGMKPNLIRSTGWTCSSRSMSRRPLMPRRCRSALRPPVLQKPIDSRADAPGDHLLQPDERAAADEQDVGRIDRREFLVRMLAAALRRNIGDRAFQNLQQRLLHAFARNIAGDRRILVLAADLVDLVDIDDALLAALHIPVGVLQQPQDDVLDIFADIAGFGQRGGVDDGERHIQNPRQRLGQQRFAGTGGADQQDVRLRKLDIAVRACLFI